MDRKALESAIKDWSQMGSQNDLIDSRFKDPILTFALGPLTDAAWDSAVVHEPEIPIYVQGEINLPPPTADVPAKEAKPADADSFDDRAAAGGGAAQGGPGLGAAGGMRAGGPATGYGPGGGMPGYGGGYGRPRSGGPQASTDPNAIPDYYLFRFFDFTVEPGKRYIYRVQLVVANPNRGMRPVFLEKPEYEKKPNLTGKWSEASPVVSVPNDTSTLAVAVEQPKRLIGDPLGSMLVALWKQDSGKKVYNEFAVERGQLLNFNDAEVNVVSRRGGYGAPASNSDKEALLSNILVIDMAGGKKLPTGKPKPPPEDVTDQYGKKLPAKGKDRGAYSPGEILIMEPDGALVVRDEYDDMASVGSYTAKPDEVPGGQGPGYGPGGRGYGPPPGYGPQGGPPPGYGPQGGVPPGYGPQGGTPPGYGPPTGYGPPPGAQGYGPAAGPAKGGGRTPGLFDQPGKKPRN